MKKIINNKVYSTDTARTVGSHDNGLLPNDLNYSREALYIKKTGEYFLHGNGGANTRYAHQCDTNRWCGGESIMPLTYAEAKQWAQAHLEADEYTAEFGTIVEDDSTTMTTLRLPSALYEAVRRKAQEQGTSMAALIQTALEAAIK